MIALANNSTPEEPDDSGGRGKSIDPHRIRGELRLMRRAIRNDYPMSETARKEMVETALDVMRSSECDRARIAAVMALAACDNINVKRETLDQRDEHAYLPKTVMHLRPSDVREFNENELDRIIAGDFTPIEDGSGGGEETPDSGEAEPT